MPKKQTVKKTQAVKVSVAQGDERYSLLVANVKEYAIILLDPKGRITDWNRGGEHLFGYTEADVIGKSVLMIFTPEDRKLGKPKVELRLALETGRAEDENWL